MCFYLYEHPRILPFISGCVERERKRKKKNIMELLQRNTEKKRKGEKVLAFVHLSVMEESSQFIPYSQRELTLVRRAGKLKADAAELGLKGREMEKIKGRKRKKTCGP